MRNDGKSRARSERLSQLKRLFSRAYKLPSGLPFEAKGGQLFAFGENFPGRT